MLCRNKPIKRRYNYLIGIFQTTIYVSIDLLELLVYQEKHYYGMMYHNCPKYGKIFSSNSYKKNAFYISYGIFENLPASLYKALDPKTVPEGNEKNY